MQCPVVIEQQKQQAVTKNEPPTVTVNQLTPVTKNPVTENSNANSVTVTQPVTKKRGRPVTGTAMSNAERQRRWRQRQATQSSSHIKAAAQPAGCRLLT